MNGKTLGSGSGPNARPLTSFNQRPQAPQLQQGGNSYGRQAQPRPQPVQQPKPAGHPVSSAAAPKAVPGGTSAMPQKPAAQTPQQSRSDGAESFVQTLREMVGGFSILSDEVIQRNVALMTGTSLSYDDRTVSFECADYVISNLAYIFMGLVLDNNFKESFLDALNVELQIDSQPANVREQTRKQMKDPKQYKSTGSIVLGVTTFLPPIMDDLMKKMQDGFSKLDAFADEFDAEVGKMTTEQKVQLGFIFSNFMYLIRAFTHNDMFMSYVITVIEKVKGITSGK